MCVYLAVEYTRYGAYSGTGDAPERVDGARNARGRARERSEKIAHYFSRRAPARGAGRAAPRAAAAGARPRDVRAAPAAARPPAGMRENLHLRGGKRGIMYPWRRN